MTRMDHVLITGAGADKTHGIGFPLAAELLPQINSYLANDKDGQAVDTLLRRSIPGLRFRFDRFINNAINSITQLETAQLTKTMKKIQDVIDAMGDNDKPSIHKKQGQLIIRLFEQLQKITLANHIDDETRALIDEVLGNQPDLSIDDSILDARTLGASDTFKAILRYTLRQGLNSEDNKVAYALSSDLLDIENILVEKFLGFYNNKMGDIKSYVYISWCLWAFLYHNDRKVRKDHPSGVPFYSKIPRDWNAITLNYTSFLESHLGGEKTVYFHGGLTSYVRMDNRQLLSFDSYGEKSASQLIEEHISANLLFNDNSPENCQCLIPSLVPPLRLKPILSKNYIDLWHQASEWISTADHLVIIGYSLNTADEHFNDLLRSGNGKRITIIGPGVHTDYYKSRVSSIWGVSKDQFTNTVIQGKPASRLRDLWLIRANADEINLAALN